MSARFAHLHLHSEYSLIDSTIRIPELVAACAARGLPAVATEAEDYADFCEYRATAAPGGDGLQRREAWIRDRLGALALFQHHARVNASRYIDGGHPDRPFRVA